MQWHILLRMDFFPFSGGHQPLDSDCRGKIGIEAVFQAVLLGVAVHWCGESEGVLRDGGILGKIPLSGPDLVAGGVFLLAVFCDDLTNGLLEVERTQLHLGVEQAVDKDTGVQVLLRVDAEVLVFRHDSLVHVADKGELLIASVLVPIDFVAHDRLGGAHRRKSLHEEEVWTGRIISNCLNLMRERHLRDVERGIRPEVGSSDPEALLNLVGSLGTVVLDMAVFGLEIVGVEIGDGRDIGVSDLAVVALIVVIGENLPVEVAFHVPCVVEVVFIEVVVLESRLLVDSVEVVLPSYLGRLASIQVDPDEAVFVNVCVSRGEIAAVASLDVSLVILHDNEFIASGVILNPVTKIGDAGLVRGEKPLAGEDRSSFKLVHGLRGVPGSGQSTDRSFLVLGRRSGSTKEVPQERHCEDVFVIKITREIETLIVGFLLCELLLITLDLADVCPSI